MASKRGKSKGIPSDNELDKQLEAWRKLAEAKMTLALVLRMDELSPTVMNSRKRKEKLAADLNQEGKRLFFNIAKHILANQIGRGARVTLHNGWKGLTLPKYTPEQQLSPGYLEQKREKGKTTPGYFKYSGNLLMQDLLSPNLPLFTTDDIKVIRAYESEDFHPIPGQPGKFRAQKVIRNAIGRYATKLELSTGWTIELTYRGVFAGNHPKPEVLVFTDRPDAMRKLLNGTVDGTRPYRPLLAPYLDWYRKVAIPQLIKDNYSKPAVRKK